MAFFKFYNIQLLPINNDISEVGDSGYCRLFESVEDLIDEAKIHRRKLSSIGVKMRGEMFFAPFSLSFHEYDKENNKKIIYGSFLKFDDVNELVDTNSGQTEYRSKGNTSSKRYDLEFYFDPSTHVLAIQDARGLPTRKPLIDALYKILAFHSRNLFENHSLEIDELTSAESISEFLQLPKKGYKSYKGVVTFSNSDGFDDGVEEILMETEGELKDKNVGKWESSYKSFPHSVMNDLPDQAKVQMALATRYGNAEVSYLDDDGIRKKYQMEDYPVREQLKENEHKGMKGKAVAVMGLIKKAIRRTRSNPSAVRENKRFLDGVGE